MGIGHYIGGFCFLFIGPYAAYIFGMGPVQFAFGAVQLVLNFWICIPRLWTIGCESEEDICKRVDDGWAAASILFLAVMPVVFAEMLSCESFFQHVLGHFTYDMSTILATALYSVSIWSQLSHGKKVD